MSHVVSIATKYKDQGVLVEACKVVFPGATVEVCATPQRPKTWGYGSEQNTVQPCDVIVRLQDAKQGLGDVGFYRKADGTFGIIADETDQGLDIGRKLQALAQRYSRDVTVKQARLAGYTVNETTLADGQIKLTLNRY